MPPPHAGPARALVLFDIDGTLVRRAGPHHGRALVDAIAHVTGLRATMEGVPTAGMLDRDIVAVLLNQAGASQRVAREAMRPIVRHAQRLYRDVPSLRDRVCPGVRPLLSRLRRAGIPRGLVTGNLTRIGWRKMERAGLKPYFGFGAFAEMARTRAELAGQAIRQAHRAGWANRRTRVALIGDHPNDIRAARANGALAVGVATGHTTAEELAEHGADLVVPDLRALRLQTLLERTW